MSGSAHRTEWVRARRRDTGETGWINAKTREFFHDEDHDQMIRALEGDGLVLGNPLETREWIVAEDSVVVRECR